MHLVSAEPARIRWQGIPLHALYDTAQNPGPLFGGLDLGWRDGCSGMNRQQHLGPFRKIARRLRYKSAVFENSHYVVGHRFPRSSIASLGRLPQPKTQYRSEEHKSELQSPCKP